MWDNITRKLNLCDDCFDDVLSVVFFPGFHPDVRTNQVHFISNLYWDDFDDWVPDWVWTSGGDSSNLWADIGLVLALGTLF